MTRRKVLFISWHFYLDGSNGASISTRELLHGFSQYGWEVKTLCGPCVDNSSVSDAEAVLRAHNITVNKRIQDPSSNSFEISWFNDRKIRSALFRPRVFQYIPDPITGELFLQFVDRSIKSIRPDVAIAYGGFWLASKLLRIVHNNGVKSVFMLHNFAYNDRELFTNVDLTIVPSQFARERYKERLGISTVVVPPLMRNEYIVPRGAAESSDNLKSMCCTLTLA